MTARAEETFAHAQSAEGIARMVKAQPNVGFVLIGSRRRGKSTSRGATTPKGQALTGCSTGADPSRAMARLTGILASARPEPSSLRSLPHAFHIALQPRTPPIQQWPRLVEADADDANDECGDEIGVSVHRCSSGGAGGLAGDAFPGVLPQPWCRCIHILGPPRKVCSDCFRRRPWRGASTRSQALQSSPGRFVSALTAVTDPVPDASDAVEAERMVMGCLTAAADEPPPIGAL